MQTIMDIKAGLQGMILNMILNESKICVKYFMVHM